MTLNEQFKNLTEQEVALLLKAPVLISVFAASGDHRVSKKEKLEAIKLSHLKTYTAVPELLEYYMEVEKSFEQQFEEAEVRYAPFDDNARANLKVEINTITKVMSKTDGVFADALKRSLAGYAAHVKTADSDFVANFLFPFMS